MHASAPLGEHAEPPPPTGCRRRRRRRRLPRLQVPPAPGRTQPMRLPQALWLLLGAQPLLQAPAPPAPQWWSAATGCGCRALETWTSGKSFCGAWHLCCRTCFALVMQCSVRVLWRLSWRCGWWSGTYVSTYDMGCNGAWRKSADACLAAVLKSLGIPVQDLNLSQWIQPEPACLAAGRGRQHALQDRGGWRKIAIRAWRARRRRRPAAARTAQ